MPRAPARIAIAVATCVAATALLPVPGKAAQRLEVSAKPGLWPSFAPSVTDYVSRCRAGGRLQLSIAAPAGEKVSVDGAAAKSGKFSASVRLEAGQATRFVALAAGHSKRYHVRCLPADFPRWKFQRFGTPQAQWYLFAPVGRPNEKASSRLVIIVDSNGVPVWWRRTADAPFNSLLLPNGTIAWTHWFGDPFGMSTRVHWDVNPLGSGNRIRTLRTVGSPPDTHDMEPLPNGHFLLITYRLRRDVDLRPCGALNHVNVVDGELQELSAGGKLLWAWSSKDHVSPCEAQNLAADVKTMHDGTKVYDYFHLNSVELDGDGLIISARHVSALYRIKRATGQIDWKLGGTTRAESLTVKNDPLSPSLGEQHDARLLPDGTVTVYDNRSGLGPPRAVRFSINVAKREASLIEQITDPKAFDSGSEGSARRLAGGDWVVTWGETNLITETSPASQPVFRLTLHNAINYRTQPVEYGTLKAVTLRRAMDSRFPRRR